MQEKVLYENEGQKIAGVLHKPSEKTEKGVILLHGFTGDKDNEGGDTFVRLGEQLCKEGILVLRFDCRGTGESQGRFEDMTISGEVSDLRKSIEFLKTKGITKIAVLGSSMGGCITLLAYDKDMDCLVLWYPALNMQETKRFKQIESQRHELEKHGRLFIRKSARSEWHIGKSLYEEWKVVDPYSKLKHVACPLLIVTGNQDKSVSPIYAEAGLKEVKSEKKLVIVKGADHCWRDESGEPADKYKKQAIAATVEWLKKYL